MHDYYKYNPKKIFKVRRKSSKFGKKLGIFLRGKSSITVKLNPTESEIGKLSSLQDINELDHVNLNFINSNQMDKLKSQGLINEKEDLANQIEINNSKKLSEIGSNSKSYQINTTNLTQLVREAQEEEERDLTSLASSEHKTYKDSALKSPIEEELKFLLEENEFNEFEQN
ncbi:hypothetical protein CONCODRAFT_5446 [Conidiobolus coronatus NRRL 28638]|uniref:Uncharacterized protein n=1 Tax=Conidiobolus coronatus (strain ATCC 28846 / CBS 209.66 / NRRL 28638) TaxID=796925 RepID=A0A137P9Z4_CONC2|nr:hypothetical protein CONCODRAFT_5446 [Conidiobolus coronatus NRRL 28638]|eukprot:KXN71826.1 hypothetical protein CONCODRAFT_5446 [Conidiobolus coronatus NRRL 28638]